MAGEMKGVGSMKLALLFYPQPGGGFTVICPEIHQFSEGGTIEEATANIKELIDDFFEFERRMDIEDYIAAFNTGHKIITEIEVNVK